MIRRAVLVTAAAVALTLSPTAAMAYNSSSYNVTVTDSTPTTGAPFTVNMTGGEASEAVTLGMTRNPASVSNRGARSLTRTANAGGAVAFAVTLTEAGTYVLTLSAAGEVLGTQTVTVSDDSAAAGATTDDQLANTGSDGMGLAVGGGVLVLAGAGAMLVASRRKSAQVPA